MKKKILVVVLSILFSSVSKERKEFLFPQINFNKADSLMIVAHPDDESIWGGYHLLTDNYLVVCLTNANNKVRTEEFNRVIKETNNQGIIFDFPDKSGGKRDDWKSCYSDIEKKVRMLICSKRWKKVVTHNPEGEYGHLQHKMTSRIVTAGMKEEKRKDKLFYFGKYYKKKQLIIRKKPLKTPLTKKAMKKKQVLLDFYVSQKHVEKKLSHMMVYENWIPYRKWK